MMMTRPFTCTPYKAISEIAHGVYAIVWVVLVQLAVYVGVAVRLPCAHEDCGLLGIVDIHQQEQITRVAVFARVVVLMNLDAIQFASRLRLQHLVVGETDVDELVAVEA